MKDGPEGVMERWSLELYSGTHGEDARRSTAYAGAFLLLGLLFHSITFNFILSDAIESRNDAGRFQITFDETIRNGTDQVIIADGDEVRYEITFTNQEFAESGSMGRIDVTLRYDETSGEAFDPCDSVSADIPPYGLEADWADENNSLSGSSSDCSSITLQIQVYPNYTGEDMSVIGGTGTEWLQAWTDTTYGLGTLHLDIGVDVNQPIGGGIAPTIDDNDEVVTIEWSVTWFTTTVARLP